MTNHFPEELIFDILTRLPSKSLLCFRSVCRSWCSLISSKKFKLMHLKVFNNLNRRNFIRHFDVIGNKELYSVHFDDESLTLDPCTLVKFPFDFCKFCPKSFFKIVGCVNGVICLSHDKCKSREDKVILWNPSIRKHLTLTPSMFHSSDVQHLRLVYGFGYDKTIDDFKVVRLAYDYRLFSTPQVEVYSVNSGVSRVVRFPHDLPFYSMCLDAWSQVFINGCVNWIICDWAVGESNSSVMTFDMSTELFGEIELPKYLVKKPAMFLKVSVVRGRLTVIYSSRSRLSFPGICSYIICSMREYKNASSWTLIYDVHYPNDMGCVLQLRDDAGIIMGSRYGDLKIFDYNVGYFLNRYTQFVIEEAIYVGGYKESLALLDEGHADRQKG
ncbi:F-box/kelch-repeat protein At3g23880-like [Bidens hawaiensis]|uniref:F-box/kelch-repeat protein At3g23880-like n=1 Tax=Bidens hawaiensis TaxID=980011 RepID=UPI00404B79CE